MGLAAAIDALETLLKNDAGLATWRTTHFAGKAFTVERSNVAVSAINSNAFPCIVFELGDFESEVVAVGGSIQDNDQDVPFSILWDAQDRATAYTQRIELPELVIKAVMSNKTLDGQAVQAHINKGQSHRGVGHPKHGMTFNVKMLIRVQS